MKKVEYSQLVKRKLLKLKKELSEIQRRYFAAKEELTVYLPPH